MLIADLGNRYRFVTQPAHAAVAGQFAERWGTETIAEPAPYSAAVAAAYAHDDGWFEFDRRPHCDEDGTLVGFRDVAPERWVAFYEHGIDSVADLDAYAGILASLHGTGIRRQRYGLAEMSPTDNPHYEAFVDSEEQRQRRLADSLRDAGDERLTEVDVRTLDALHETASPPPETGRLWRNYALLQTWDTLSLAVCGTLAPGDERTLPGDPAMTDGLAVSAADRATFRVEPYPFGASPLSLDVPARTVEKPLATADSALFEQYYGNRQETLTVTLRPA